MESSLQLREGNGAGLLAPDFRTLFEAVPGSLLVVLADDPHFTIAAANDAFLLIVGKSRKELIGRSIFEVFPDGPEAGHTATIGNIRASFRRVIATRQRDAMPTQRYDLPRPDGEGFEERYWSPVNSPLLGPDGAVTHIIHHPADVTKRTLAENEFRASEQRFRAFVTATSDVIYRMSADWSEMFHLSGGEFIADTAPRTALGWRSTFTRRIGRVSWQRSSRRSARRLLLSWNTGSFAQTAP